MTPSNGVFSQVTGLFTRVSETCSMIASYEDQGALLWELNSPFTVDEIEVGDPVADEVQIRLHAAGMCHSDYHLINGNTPIALPALGGHEGAGVVTKVGKTSPASQEGDHVILAFIPACGHCQPCLKGFRSLCDRGAVLLGGKAIADGTSRVHAGSHRGVADEPARHVRPVHDRAQGLRRQDRHGRPVRDRPPSWAARCRPASARPPTSPRCSPARRSSIIGVGGIGMSALQGAVISGAKHVIAIDPVEWKRDQADQVRRHPRLRVDGRGHRADHRPHPRRDGRQDHHRGRRHARRVRRRGDDADRQDRHLRGDGHGRDDRRRRQAQPVPVHDVAEDAERQHLRRRQQPRRDAEAWSGCTSRVCSKSTRW